MIYRSVVLATERITNQMGEVDKFTKHVSINISV